MTTNEEKKLYELLKADIEKVVRRKIAVKRDFEYLSAHILDRTGAYISPITLRRFWGELAGGKYDIRPRRYTLDTIARYIGHSSYEGFLSSYVSTHYYTRVMCLHLVHHNCLALHLRAANSNKE